MEITFNSGAQAPSNEENQYPGFDFDGAAAEGYSKKDMVNHAWESGKVKFDLPGARKAGYTDDEIYEEMYKRGNKSTQQAYDIDSIEPGAPDDEYEQLTSEGTIEVGKPSIIELPDQSMNVDNQTTTPMQSMPMYGEQGEFSSIVVGKDQFSQEQAIATETEKRDQAGDWYVDPISGQRIASKAVSGEAEPTWDVLFGPAGKLGAFGVLQPGVGADLAKAGVEGTSKLATKTVKMVDDYLAKSRLSGLAGDASGLSKEARIILGRHSNNPEITEDLVVQVLQGVPTKDQAYILSRFLGEQNYIKQAVNGGGDAVAAALRADLTLGKAKIQSTIGNVDVPAAMAKYGDMMTMVEREGTQNVRAANSIAEKVNQLLQETYLIPDRGQQTALRLKGALERNGNRMSLLDALEYRPEINELLRKARSHNERANLKEIKDQLDDFIGTLATTEQKTQIDEAISTYANTMQNKEAMEIIAKHTDARGIGVDWTKVHRDLAEAGLRSPEAVDALRIAEAFANKFGNDKALVNIALPQGSSFDAGGVLGISGEIANFFKNHFALWGNRAENIKIQKAIMNTLKNSKTNYDFVDNLKANKAVPPEFTEGLDKILQIPYKPGARTTGDVNLEPIVTPVGKTEETVATNATKDIIPVKTINNAEIQQAEETLMDMYIDGADSSEIRKVREAAETMKASASLPIEDNTAKALGEAIGGIHKNPTSYGRPYTLKFNDTYVPIEIDNTARSVTVDTESFINGSGEGSKFYTKLWSTLNNLGYKQDVVGLSVVNQLRLPINAFKFKQDGNKLPIDNTRFTELTTDAIGILNKELKRVNKKPIQNLTDEELVDIGATLGKDPEFRLNTNSLKLYRKAARLLSDGKALSIVVLAPFINQAYSEIEED